jgi:DNA-binding SARP family transcriptional activator
MLETHGAYAHLTAGNVGAVEQLLKDAAATTSGGRLYRAHGHFLAFLKAFYEKDTLHALASAREAVALADAAGVPLCQGLYRVALAHALFSRDERREALRHLAQARRVGRHMRSPNIEFSCAYTAIYFMLERGKHSLALPLLRKTLGVAKQRGYLNRLFWTPEITARLFGAALEHGIEVEYVQESIRRRKLVPTAEAMHMESWPFAVRIYTLGRFSVMIDGKPMQFNGKAQRKPLELLMALVAFGGREVSERQLTEALWPDAEGDAAHQTCAVALHRLRKLLGCEQAILLQRNHFSLNPQYVWVDVWAFQRGLSPEHGKPEGISPGDADPAVMLYQGPFLGTHVDLTWAIPVRESLRTKFLRHLAARGSRLMEGGQRASAIELFEKGLSIEPVAEGLYYDLMLCYHAADRRAEAVAVYRRCEKVLAASLGMPPAPRLAALCRAIQTESLP